MSRRDHHEQAPAIPRHKAHQNLVRGMAVGIEKILPPDLRFIILVFSESHEGVGSYVSNGRRRSIAFILDRAAREFAPLVWRSPACPAKLAERSGEGEAR